MSGAGPDRDAIAAGRGDFLPMHLSRVPRLIREGKIKVDVTVVQVSPPDKNGYVSLGPTAAATIAAMEIVVAALYFMFVNLIA